ncbi:collagen alpha-2(iv) chain [Plakobranchus ocellatus]|uniref:Collagen alpha-2(Iv) chain n=1 Tax=Plakobranchus ocellatus TaxID=259542 RepID=A0AAV3XYK5_9GAST|nr:collagen alpha-2(iv) chain [Plakobranchus ocellatus]
MICTGTPGTPGTPTTVTTPRTPSTTATPSTPGTPSTVTTPGTPSTPATPETPGTPSTVPTPGTPSTPATLGTPGTRGTPTMPNTPGTPGTPATGTPTTTVTTSGTPATLSTPGTPSTSTVATPGTLSTSGTPRIPVCENIVEVTKAHLSELPMGPLVSEPAPPEVGFTDFEYVVMPGHSRLTISIEMPLGAQLLLTNLEGTYDSYSVIIVDENGDETTQKNTEMENIFDRDIAPSNVFTKSSIPDSGQLVIQVTGPSGGFTVQIIELKLCLPEIQFCRLGYEEVLEALKFLPVHDELGVNSQNQTVKFGDHGDYLESGVTIFGSCYQCLCANYSLECFENSDCDECPARTVECVGECSNAVEVVTYTKPGVHPNCLVNSSEPCVPDTCTTPHMCPGPWSSWSPCSQQCQQFRSRECGPGCPDSCRGFNLTEAQTCDSCLATTTTPAPTTPHECDQNEVYACVTAYDQCLASCGVLMRQSVCDALLDDASCIDTCACAKGYVSECTSNGYNCQERNDCCELSQWSDWTPCSRSCGTGTKTRQRTKKGNGCDPKEQMVESQICEQEECPCIHNGEVWESGRVVEDICKSCECSNGEFLCNVLKEPDELWRNEDCSKHCYCNETGFEVCFENEELKACKDIRENCNDETHTLRETDDLCCPECVPIMTPCGYKSTGNETLTVVGDDSSVNCTAVVEMGTCYGTCGSSYEAATHLTYKDGHFQLYTEPNCSCCKAVTATKDLTFSCQDGTDIHVAVGYIKDCSCEMCS